MSDRDIGIPRRHLLQLAKDLNGMVVSLDRLGSAFDGEELARATDDYLDRADVFARLAVAREVVCDALLAELATEEDEIALEEEISAGSTRWPALGEPVVLSVSAGVRDTLIRVLEVARDAPAEARIVDLLEGWDDLRAFTDQVFGPLERRASAAAGLVVSAYEAGPLFTVLEGVAESYSGGVPWVVLDPTERFVVDRVLDRLTEES